MALNSRPQPNRLVAVVVIVAVVLVGLTTLVLTRAAGPLAAFEPELGNLSGGAKNTALSGASGGGALVFATPTPAPTPQPGWVLRWQDNPALGLANFEGVEDDRADSHPNVTHIFARDGGYRFEMHTADADGSDRQRQEVYGAKPASGGYVDIQKGSVWKQIYDVYLPSSWNGSPHFAHMNQVKQISLQNNKDAGSPSLPVVTLTLGGSGSNSNMQVVTHYPSQQSFNAIPLAPLQNKWVTIELEYKFDYAANGGYVRIKVSDGQTVVTDKTKTSVDMWVNAGTGSVNRMRPKWGIYRYLDIDRTDTYMLIRNMHWYQKP